MLPDTERLSADLEGAPPGAVVKRALELFGADVSIAFSGAEDVLLIEYAKQSDLPFRVFTLDTGRLHPETYRFCREVERHYDIHIEYCFPQARLVQDLVRKKGLFSFFDDGHTECCSVRKVEPLRRYLAGVSAWITGQRRDQNSTRSAVPTVQLDPAYAGTDDAPLVKFNPLADVDAEYVWGAIRGFEVPHNPLFERGYRSIGCEPCTRAVMPGQDEREGRWWWENADKKECGMHVVPAPDANKP